MRIKIVLNYDGANFVGWQRQRGGGSVQDCLEDAVFRLTGERVSICGSGRTDAGVHALGQVAHFDLVRSFAAERIAPGLNFYLPKTVRIQKAEIVCADFHARKSAKQKTYIYMMYKSHFDNALLDGKALRIHPDADIALMKEAAAHFVGTHDFYAFMSAGSSAKTSVRTIFSSEITNLFDQSFSLTKAKEEKIFESGEINLLAAYDGLAEKEGVQSNKSSLFESNFLPPLIIYKVTANGFLYNMVRKIMGCILRAGLEKIEPSDVSALIKACDRSLCKDMALPHGLYLHSVDY